MSNAWSATRRFRRPFSFSNAYNCLARSGAIPPYFWHRRLWFRFRDLAQRENAGLVDAPVVHLGDEFGPIEHLFAVSSDASNVAMNVN